MKPQARYFTYITASHTRLIYVGFTDDLPHRLRQHKNKSYKGYTAKFNIDRLVYFEEFPTAEQALAREQHLKVGAGLERLR